MSPADLTLSMVIIFALLILFLGTILAIYIIATAVIGIWRERSKLRKRNAHNES